MLTFDNLHFLTNFQVVLMVLFGNYTLRTTNVVNRQMWGSGFLLIDFHLFIFYFFIFRKGRKKEKERNIDMREKHQLVASRTCPNWGPNQQPRHMPYKKSNQGHFIWGMVPNPLSYNGQGAFHFLLGRESFYKSPQNSLNGSLSRTGHMPTSKLIIDLTNQDSFPEGGQMPIHTKLNFCHRIST